MGRYGRRSHLPHHPVREAAATTAAVLVLILPAGAVGGAVRTAHPQYTPQALATGMPPVYGPYGTDVAAAAGSAPVEAPAVDTAPLTSLPPPPDLTGTGLTDPGPLATEIARRPAPPPVSPVVARLQQEAAEVEALGERVVEERDTHAVLLGDAIAGEALWGMASDRYRASHERAEQWARRAYLLMARTGSPLPGPRTDVVRSQHAEAETVLSTDGGRLGTDATAAARELTRATQAYAQAHLSADVVGAEVRRLDAELTRRREALERLRRIHRAELTAALIRAEAYDSAISRRYLSGLGVAGGTSAPAALAAVQYALSQLGKPYVWGAEGPDTYDCSGLVQAAYAAAGITLPRTARPQYLATTPVPVDAMVPGDLLFFGPDSSEWNSIHHVGIYLGDGKMVHAPTTGDVVRVAPIWWAEFFGATRVVGAVASGGLGGLVTARPPLPLGAEPTPSPAAPSAPGSPRPPSPSPSPSPSKSPAPSPGPIGPTPPPTPSPAPPWSPSPTPTPTPTPSCPTPDPSPSASPSATPSASPTDPPCSPSPTPTPSNSTAETQP